MPDLIKYHNDMNKISFNGFNEKELNLFFSLCFKAKNIGTNEVCLSFSELRKLSRGDINLSRFLKTLKTTYDKLITLPFHYRNEKGFGAFVLFNKYFVNEIEKTITIKLSEDFEYILNNLIGNFTKFDLIEFVSLKSSYSKNVFKLLKQWESKKEKVFPIEEFREFLSIPIKYRISEIDKFVLKPISIELPQYFNNLKIEKIKTGKKVTHLKFTWTEKKVNLKEVKDIEILISTKLKNTIDKAKKNRFIFPFLTEDNIEILIKEYEEKDLIKGLNWAYKKIDNEIHNFNYLKKSITTGIETPSKKIIEKISSKEETIETNISINHTNGCIEKKNDLNTEIIKITRSDYENLYKEYLKNNNSEHNNFVRRAFDISNKNKYEIIENNDDDKKPPLPPTEDLSQQFLLDEAEYIKKRKLQEQYMNEIYEIAKEVRKYIAEQKLEIIRLSSNILSKKIHQKKIHEYQEENKFLEHLVCEFGIWGVRLTTQTDYALLKEMVKFFNENIAETIEIFNLIFERMEINKRLDKEFFENMIADCIETEFSSARNLSTLELKKRFSLVDISEDKLLSKTGKKLVGGALISRLGKIAKEEEIEIEYNGKIIKSELL